MRPYKTQTHPHDLAAIVGMVEKEGLSSSKIADRMGVTKGVISGIRYKMKLGSSRIWICAHDDQAVSWSWDYRHCLALGVNRLNDELTREEVCSMVKNIPIRDAINYNFDSGENE